MEKGGFILSYIEESDSIMRPMKGDTKIRLPITFNYNGGRSEYNKTRIMWVCILAVLGLIIGVGILTSSDGNFIINILLGFGFMFGVSVIIRFLIMKEHIVRNNMLSTIDEDYKIGTDSFWGDYAIDDEYPYYVHMRNGKTALFVRFEKDVILGRVSDSEYEHYEAIGDAYNLAGSYNIGVCHIDYMDVIGNDDRIDNCFRSLSEVSNPDMRDLLTDIYTNLQMMMNEMVTTFDVYVFTFKYSESSFWFSIQKVISCMLDANYSSFTILNADEIRGLSKSLFNLHDFSVVDACSNAFGTSKKASVVPIKVIKSDGTEVKLNKTLEEKKLADEENKNKKNNKGRKGRISKSKDINDEEINIFED